MGADPHSPDPPGCPPVTHRSAARTTSPEGPRDDDAARSPGRARPSEVSAHRGSNSGYEQDGATAASSSSAPDAGVPAETGGSLVWHTGWLRRAGAVAASATCFTAIVVALVYALDARWVDTAAVSRIREHTARGHGARNHRNAITCPSPASMSTAVSTQRASSA